MSFLVFQVRRRAAPRAPGTQGTQRDPKGGQGPPWGPRAPSAPLGGMGPWGPLGLLRSYSEWKAISKCWVIAKGKSFRHEGRSESNHLKLWVAQSPESKWWKMVFGFLSIFQLGGGPCGQIINLSPERTLSTTPSEGLPSIFQLGGDL